MSKAASVDEESFSSEVLESQTPVLVDFWAEWCGPCRMVAPVLDQVASEKEGQLKIVKVNVDENPGLARAYQVISIPNMTLFKNGSAVAQIIGARPKHAIVAELERHL